MSLLVIAEAGVNHNGDLDRACVMVRAAADAGADYIKFQAFSADQLVARGAPTAEYQAATTGERDQFALLQALEIGLDGFATLAEECRTQRVGFMATAFDANLVEALIALGMDRIKVASGELTNIPALRHFARLEKPVLLSTGMATLDEVERAIICLRKNGAKDITLLQCTSLYPAPPEAINLGAMRSMATYFDLPVGLSDHSLGDHAAIAAVALGATVVEKHFTLDRSLRGPDHAASLEPGELAGMIRKLREIGAMLGDGRKVPTRDELATAQLVRRSWHAVRDLAAGTIIAADSIVLKRPADGLAPEASPVGRTLVRAVAADAPLTAADLTDSRIDKAAV